MKGRVVEWCFKGVTELSLANTSSQNKLVTAKKEEDAWGNMVMGTQSNVQWSSLLCERIVAEALTALGRKNIRHAAMKEASVREKSYSPDLECDKYVYEVKGRSWTTTGTAGEKILGVPLKYGEVPRLYHKPLQIVLVGYQEYEARKAFAFGDLLNEKEQTSELRESLAFYKEHDIEYVGFTDILKQLGLGKEYWNGK